MPIVFNIYAIFQTIIAVIILGLIHLLVYSFGFDYDLLGGSNEAFISLQILALITAYLDVKGIKGSLFFLPTWITLIFSSIFVFYITYTGEVFNKYQYLLYFSSIIITIIYIRLNRKELMEKWEKKKIALNLLNSKLEASSIDNKEFWILSSNIYYKPSYLFLYFNPIWSKIYSNVIDGDDFLKHYQDFINKIELDNVDKKSHKKWVANLKKALNKARNMKDYEHLPFSLSRLGNIINHQNETFANK